MTDELCLLTIGGVADLIRTKQVSPVEVTQAVLRRIEDTEPRLNAFITVAAEMALSRAVDAEKETACGRYRGPLHGVPLALKDLFYTKGIRTTCGSRLRKEFVPGEDSTAVQRLYEAGAVLIGKTNMHEFAYGSTNEHSHFGPVHNPWDLSAVSGGSSGGSAAAVAAACCFGALGTDTGGSIRIPASCCGVAGLKPTYGRVSAHNVVALAPSLDHAGPLARSVGDIAILLNAIAGHDSLDPASASVPVPDFTEDLGAGVRGLRIGVPREFFFENLDPEVEEAVRSAIAELARAGAEVLEVSIPTIYESHPASTAIMAAEAAKEHEENLRLRGTEFCEPVRERLEAGFKVTAVDYLKALEARSQLTADFEAAFQTVGVIATPTLAIPPTSIGQATVQFGGQDLPSGMLLTRLTRPGNLTGMPVISVPCGFTSSGLPIGLQLTGRHFDEATVLRTAAAYESMTEWHLRRPRVE